MASDSDDDRPISAMLNVPPVQPRADDSSDDDTPFAQLPRKAKLPKAKQEEPQSSDDDTQERIAKLERLKAEAVAKEDYELAASLKKQIERLKAGGQPVEPVEPGDAHPFSASLTGKPANQQPANQQPETSRARWDLSADQWLWSNKHRPTTALATHYQRTSGAIKSRLKHLQNPEHSAHQRLLNSLQGPRKPPGKHLQSNLETLLHPRQPRKAPAEQPLPPGWKKLTSASRPGLVMYLAPDGNRHQTLPPSKCAVTYELGGVLREYRLQRSRELSIKPYTIFSDAELEAVVAARPRSVEELGRIRGFGPTKSHWYGEDIVGICSGHLPSCVSPKPNDKPKDTATNKRKHSATAPLSPTSERLRQTLKNFRTEQANALGQPSYCIFKDSVLDEVVLRKPRTPVELLAISGMGPSTVEKFGDSIIALCDGRKRILKKPPREEVVAPHPGPGWKQEFGGWVRVTEN